MTASLYPGALDNNGSMFSDVGVGGPLGPGHWNNLRDMGYAVEQTLGVNPQGSYATVAARLAAMGGGSALNLASAVPSADVAVSVGAAATVDVCTLALAAGTWEVRGQIAHSAAFPNAYVQAQLYDGTTVRGGQVDGSNAAYGVYVVFGRYVVAGGGGTIHLRLALDRADAGTVRKATTVNQLVFESGVWALEVA
jgi:hypothetical protein